MMPSPAFSAAAERNKAPILARLRHLLAHSRHVLEIGSGTTQHAVHFAAALPFLEWTCSDLPERKAFLREQLRKAALPNLRDPLALDVTAAWPPGEADAVFSANTLHIMPWSAVEQLFAAVRKVLPSSGRLVIYGPFHYGGRSISPGNEQFDRELRVRGTGAGIRHAEEVHALAASQRLRLLSDFAMPTNNRLFAWEKMRERT